MIFKGSRFVSFDAIFLSILTPCRHLAESMRQVDVNTVNNIEWGDYLDAADLNQSYSFLYTFTWPLGILVNILPINMAGNVLCKFMLENKHSDQWYKLNYTQFWCISWGITILLKASLWRFRNKRGILNNIHMSKRKVTPWNCVTIQRRVFTVVISLHIWKI